VTPNTLAFPNYTQISKDANATLTLHDRSVTPDRPIWYGGIIEYVPYTLNLQSLLALLKVLGVLPSILGKKDWWGLVLSTLFTKGYKADYTKLAFKGTGTKINFDLLRAKSCPIKRGADGTIKDNEAKDSVFRAAHHAETGETAVFGDKYSSLTKGITAGAAVSASSSFWNTAIVEGNYLEYEATRGWLLKFDAKLAPPTPEASPVMVAESSEEVYAMDGGVLDTTGIVPHLRDKVDKVVSLYNNNDALEDLNSTFAYLFGVRGPITDSMNSLEGPELAQVFPTELYADVIANLTDPSILRAHLTNVPVQANRYFGVGAYTLQHLYIISNHKSPDFLDSFVDPAVVSGKGLLPGWPNNMTVSMDTYNANMLCLFSQWKIKKHVDELKAIL